MPWHPFRSTSNRDSLPCVRLGTGPAPCSPTGSCTPPSGRFCADRVGWAISRCGQRAPVLQNERSDLLLVGFREGTWAHVREVVLSTWRRTTCTSLRTNPERRHLPRGGRPIAGSENEKEDILTRDICKVDHRHNVTPSKSWKNAVVMYRPRNGAARHFLSSLGRLTAGVDTMNIFQSGASLHHSVSMAPRCAPWLPYDPCESRFCLSILCAACRRPSDRRIWTSSSCGRDACAG